MGAADRLRATNSKGVACEAAEQAGTGLDERGLTGAGTHISLPTLILQGLAQLPSCSSRLLWLCWLVEFWRRPCR